MSTNEPPEDRKTGADGAEQVVATAQNALENVRAIVRETPKSIVSPEERTAIGIVAALSAMKIP